MKPIDTLRSAFTILTLAAAMACGGPARSGAKSAGGRPGSGAERSIPVTIVPARSGDIDVVIGALGTVAANSTAVVKSRVDGQLVKVLFKEGQPVKAGAVLAEIDPRPFQVQLEQAAGKLRSDQAQLANAQADLERFRSLNAQGMISAQQLESQRAQVRQFNGALASDQASVNGARLQLTYSRVVAPISGRLGLRQVDTGNIIRANDAGGLVIITQTQPVNAVFAIPADSLGPVLKRLRAGETLQVEAFDREGKSRLATGTLLTADNQIDSATGTVKLKAEFPNIDEALFPDQFVNIRLRVETRHGVTLIPTAAVQRGAQGTFCYVAKEKSVAMRPVTLGPVSGETVAVEKGLAPGDEVVVDGADKLRDGATVEATLASDKPATEGRGAHRDSGSSPDTAHHDWPGLSAPHDSARAKSAHH